MADLNEAPTPALVVDLSVMDANIRFMQSRARQLGVKLRPHMKTSKSLEVARRLRPGDGVCVSTLQEAAYFHAGGVSDICCPNIVAPDAYRGFAELAKKGAKLTLVVADASGALALRDSAACLGVDLDVLVEIESGGLRTGIRPDDAGLVDVASIIHAGPNTRLAGVMTYAGQAYACRSAAEIRVVAGRERDAAVAASKRLNASSLPCPVISVGSTPSCVHASELAGVTEIRPGNFIFFDCMQVAAGVVGLDRIALSVLATVVSSDCRSGRVVVDAGALALSKDGAGADFGYGVAADIEGRPLAGPPHVSRLYQEHGVIEDVTPEMAARIPVGAKLRILPYHACLTAAQFNRYIVVDGDAGVVDFWGKATGSYN